MLSISSSRPTPRPHLYKEAVQRDATGEGVGGVGHGVLIADVDVLHRHLQVQAIQQVKGQHDSRR